MAIVASPTVPTAGVEVTLSITSVVGTADATQYVLTAVPDRSTLPTGLLVDENGDPVATWMPDVQGAFSFEAYDYRRVTGRASYAGDPDAGERLVLVAKQTGDIYVGAIADLPIVTTRGDGALLRLTVQDSFVRGASLINPITDVARVAAKEPAVIAALAGIQGVAVNSIDLDFVDDINDMCAKFALHIIDEPVVHTIRDTTNTLLREGVDSIEGAILRVNDLYDKYIGHVQALSNGGAWHGTDDGRNLPVVPKATSHSGALVLKADLRERCYERHRVQVATPASHGGADNTNVLSAPLTLTTLIVAFLDALVDATPVAPTGEQEASVDIARAFGFDITGQLDVPTGIGVGSTVTVVTDSTFTVASVKVANYTAVAGEIVRCNPTGGSFIITLPSAAMCTGCIVRVKNVTNSTNEIIVDGPGAETIDDEADFRLNIERQSMDFQSDGVNWMIV